MTPGLIKLPPAAIEAAAAAIYDASQKRLGYVGRFKDLPAPQQSDIIRDTHAGITAFLRQWP